MKSGLFKFVVLLFIAVILMGQLESLAAQGLLKTYNAIVHKDQVSTYEYEANGSSSKFNDKGYLVVGNGEFQWRSLVFTVEATKPNAEITIEHASICANKQSSQSNYTGVDSPAPSSLDKSKTIFTIGTTFGPVNASKIVTKTYGYDCSDLNDTFTLKGLQRIDTNGDNKINDDDPPRYGAWFYARLDTRDSNNQPISTSTSLQNSFRVIVNNDIDANVGYSSRIVNELLNKDKDLMRFIGVTDRVGISLANTDLPRFSKSNYELLMSTSCGAEVGKSYNVEFYDIDDSNGGSGPFWQSVGANVAAGFKGYPTVEFQVMEQAVRYVKDGNGKIIRIEKGEWETMKSVLLNGPDSGNGETTSVRVGPFSPRYNYKFKIKNVYRANAIQFSFPNDADIVTGDYETNDCENPRDSNPVAYAEQCSIINGKTVIKGWAYDANSGNAAQPRVDLKVGGTDYNNLPSNLSYRTGFVNNYVDDNFYGTEGKDNLYGWEATIDGLVRGQRYPISGVVNNVGEGNNQSVEVNKRNFLIGATGERTEVNGFPNERIPDDCIPAAEGFRAACTLISFSADEPGVQGTFKVNVQAGNLGLIAVTRVIIDSRFYGNFVPTNGDMVNEYLSPAIKIEKNQSNTFTSKPGYFPDPKNYQDVIARIEYVYGKDGKIVGGGTFCAKDIPIAKKPYLKVYGGDVWSGGKFPGLATIGTGSVYGFANANGVNSNGSSSQLGLMALRNIKGFYSSSLRTSAFSATAPKGTTFANTDSSKPFGGGFGANARLNLIDYYADTRDTSLGSSTLPSESVPVNQGKVQYVYPADREIRETNIGRGSQAAVYIDGDVYISGNIVYDSASRTKISDIPFFALIVKGDIYISGNVTNLDGMYVAQPYKIGNEEKGGRIFTCSAYLRIQYPTGGGGIANNCGSKLTVNGSFIARQIKFLRHNQTLSLAPARETRQSNGAGEVFNFNPEMYMAPSPLRNGTDSNTEVNKYDAVFSLPPVL